MWHMNLIVIFRVSSLLLTSNTSLIICCGGPGGVAALEGAKEPDQQEEVGLLFHDGRWKRRV